LFKNIFSAILQGRGEPRPYTVLESAMDFRSQIEAETGKDDPGQDINDIMIPAVHCREDQAENRD